MSHVIILAARTADGNAYAREHRADLPRGRFIVPTSAAQIDGVVPSKVIELPGFGRRPDRHAILAAVKRSVRRYQDCEWVEVGAEDPRGPLTERQVTVAYRYNALVDAGIPENVDPVIAMASVEVTPEDIVAEEADEAPKRRASLCKVCSTKHIKGENCPGPEIFE